MLFWFKTLLTIYLNVWFNISTSSTNALLFVFIVIKIYSVKIQVNSKIFIICFLSINQFFKSEDLLELKSSNTSFNHTKQHPSYYLEYCYSGSSCSSIYARFVDNRCRCAPNYKLNTDNYQCENFKCTLDSDCWNYDYNRYCSYGTQ